MTNWTNKIELGKIFKKYNAGEMSISDVGKETAKKILQTVKRDRYLPVMSLTKLANKFKTVKTETKYNSLLNELFDYGDDWKIWIDTFH